MSKLAHPPAHPMEQVEIMAYLDGELDAERGRVAADHLAECAECSQLAGQLRGVSRQFRDWEIEPCALEALALPPEIHMPNALQRVWRTIWRPVWQRPWAWAAAGAVIAALVISLPRRSAVESSYRGLASNQLASTRSSDVAQYLAQQVGVAQNASPNPEPAPAPPVQIAAQIAGQLAATSPAPVQTMIAQSVQLSLVTRDFDRARTTLESIVQRRGGYVGELNVSAPSGEARSLDATLHVPAAQLDASLTEIRALGRVESESRAGEDVTRQYVDLEARLANSRNAERRLTELMRDRTGRLTDVLAVEMEIARVREQIERMEAERKTLAGRVDFAAISVKIAEDYKAQVPSWPGSIGNRFRNAAVDGYRSMVEGVASVALFLLSWGPGLLLWTLVLFWPARYAWRKYRQARSSA